MASGEKEDGVIVDVEFTEIEEKGGELVVHPHTVAQTVSLFGTDEPDQVVEKASKVATALAAVVETRNLYKVISGKKHVLVEGWTLLGSMLGVFPVMESCEPVELNGVKGYKAVVAAQTRDGSIIGRASALCMKNESRWARADEYAISSMAQTRATSKCLRAPLGFIMQLAGYEATPEAEIPAEGFDNRPAAAPKPEPQPLSEKTIARLAKGMTALKGKPGWSTEEVLATAAQTFKRPIAAIADLREDEAKQIIDAMDSYGGVKV